jgi:hypothetical protein
MGLYSVAAVLRWDITHKITHRTQTKHSTQNIKNNKGHILHTVHTITKKYNYKTNRIQLQYNYNYNTNTIRITINLKLMN